MTRRGFFKKIALASAVVAGVAVAKETEVKPITEEELQELRAVVSAKKAPTATQLSKEALKSFDAEVMKAYADAAGQMGKALGERQDKMIIEAMNRVML